MMRSLNLRRILLNSVVPSHLVISEPIPVFCTGQFFSIVLSTPHLPWDEFMVSGDQPISFPVHALPLGIADSIATPTLIDCCQIHCLCYSHPRVFNDENQTFSDGIQMHPPGIELRIVHPDRCRLHRLDHRNAAASSHQADGRE